MTTMKDQKYSSIDMRADPDVIIFGEATPEETSLIDDALSDSSLSQEIVEVDNFLADKVRK